MLKQTKKSIPDPSTGDTIAAAFDSDWFKSFFLLSGELLCIIDNNGYYKKVNNAWAGLLGYDAAALYNQPLHAYVHEDDRQGVREMVSLATEGAAVKEFESRFTCSTGSTKWLSCSATLLQEDSLLLVIARDVTSKKLAEEELKRKTDEVNMIVSSLDDIVFEFDSELRYKKAWCHDQDLLKIMPRQFLGKTPEEAFAAMPQLASLFMDDLRQSLQKKEIHYRDFSMHIGHEIKWFNSKISPLFTRGLPSALPIFLKRKK
jgi:PAS domain S-box-containing protein